MPPLKYNLGRYSAETQRVNAYTKYMGMNARVLQSFFDYYSKCCCSKRTTKFLKKTNIFGINKIMNNDTNRMLYKKWAIEMHRRRNARNVNPHHHKIKWQTIFSSFSEFINLMMLLVVDRSSCILHGNIYCWYIHFMSVCQLKINTTSSKACFQWKFNSIEIEMKLLKKHNVKLASFDMFANCNSTVHSFQFNSIPIHLTWVCNFLLLLNFSI